MDIRESRRMPQIAIGLIGSASAVESMKSVVKRFPTFAPLLRQARDEREAVEAAAALAGQAEVILIAGARLHTAVKRELETGIPVLNVPLTDVALYRSLMMAWQSGQLTGGLSIDSLTASMVHRVLAELGLEHVPTIVYDGPAHATESELLRFHLEQRSRCSAALTGEASVAEELARAGIASWPMEPSSQDISVALERALLSTESRRSKESQMVIGMINIDDFHGLVQHTPSEHEVQRLKLDIHRLLLGYVATLDGYLTALGGDEYMFITTRGIFERETGGYKMIPLARDANKSHGLSLSIGVGFGASANEAGTHARAALRKAKEAGGNSCFIVREDRTLIGPLEMADPVRHILAPTDAELIKRAEDAGMTSAYLSKLLSHKARYGKLDYTVHELAALLGITVRSAHRLLLLWTDERLVEIAGMEKVPKGRPRQIYRFAFLQEK
ncbi:hypothetical protein PA598K_06025 [Paenibacillus sp. 598K]|uniref:hypothetical protein n=1 Tax=Paenibacillus sp. 598K TaxID=1117987 RepID=UPI000FFA95A2|nr:hypothetical protein [Paenibacillus sp. 598K]GBF77471.1 hypothetical protein PA598K_06025 [Paenibacillus sp. 598K]